MSRRAITSEFSTTGRCLNLPAGRRAESYHTASSKLYSVQRGNFRHLLVVENDVCQAGIQMTLLFSMTGSCQNLPAGRKTQLQQQSTHDTASSITGSAGTVPLMSLMTAEAASSDKMIKATLGCGKTRNRTCASEIQKEQCSVCLPVTMI